MTEGEKTRLLAWSQELRRVHARLREALKITRTALGSGPQDQQASHDLLLFCHGFCAALTGHHEGEDRDLFPAIAAAHPDLRRTLRLLEQDHSMIARLLSEMQAAVDAAACPADLERDLDGIAAIMENHFRYEEDKLLPVMETLALDADPGQVLGPLWLPGHDLPGNRPLSIWSRPSSCAGGWTRCRPNRCTGPGAGSGLARLPRFRHDRALLFQGRRG